MPAVSEPVASSTRHQHARPHNFLATCLRLAACSAVVASSLRRRCVVVASSLRRCVVAPFASSALTPSMMTHTSNPSIMSNIYQHQHPSMLSFSFQRPLPQAESRKPETTFQPSRRRRCTMGKRHISLYDRLPCSV